MATIKQVQVNGTTYDVEDVTKLPLTGGTLTGDLIINAPWRDSYYASNLCRHFSPNTPTEFVIKTKIKYVSGNQMPVVRLYGYAYGENSPIELRIGWYIFNGSLGYCGVVSTGAWKPNVYLYKYTANSTDWVAIGLKGACYFAGFSVDAQVGSLGSFDSNFLIDGWTTENNGADTSKTLIPAIGTSNCIQVPYKTMKTDISGEAGSVAWANVSGKPTVTGSKGSTAESAGAHTHSLSATAAAQTFTGTSGTTDASASLSHNHSVTAAGTIGTGTGTANYTPAGSVANHSHSIGSSTVSVNSLTGAGSAPALTITSVKVPKTDKTAAFNVVTGVTGGTAASTVAVLSSVKTNGSASLTGTTTFVTGYPNFNGGALTGTKTFVTGVNAATLNGSYDSTTKCLTLSVSGGSSSGTGTVGFTAASLGTASTGSVGISHSDPTFNSDYAVKTVTGASASGTATFTPTDIGSASGWSAGSVPSYTAVTVVKSVDANTGNKQPGFTGTGVQLTFTGSAVNTDSKLGTHTHTFKPAGTNAASSVSGTAASAGGHTHTVSGHTHSI